MAQTKSEWRRALLADRAAIPASVRRCANGAIAARVRELAWMRQSRTLLGYVAIGSEVDIRDVLAGEMPIVVRVPTGPFDAEDPLWALPSSADDEPTMVTAGALAYPAMAIVPGIGFDLAGTRLGRGGGFYDRAIGRLRAAGLVFVVGVAFDCQIVSELPRDAWDERVDLVVSESRLVTPASESSSCPGDRS